MKLIAGHWLLMESFHANRKLGRYEMAMTEACT